MRLFTAIQFSTDTVSGLCALRDEIRSKATRGRFSSADNLHLTLVFLGECNEAQAAAARAALDAMKFAAFSLEIDSLGRFQGARGDIWWAGVRENQALLELQVRLAQELMGRGFSLEERPYVPHITLGRQISSKIAPWPIHPLADRVDQIVLMKSEQIEGKLTYTLMHVQWSKDP